MTSRCNTCTHLQRFTDTTGQCRRHAPVLGEKYGQASFPLVTTLEDWCGEYSGNTQPLTEDEIRSLKNPSYMPVFSIKPTPYHKDPST